MAENASENKDQEQPETVEVFEPKPENMHYTPGYTTIGSAKNRTKYEVPIDKIATAAHGTREKAPETSTESQAEHFHGGTEETAADFSVDPGYDGAPDVSHY